MAANDISGLAGVIIWTEHFEPMLTFYRDVLGLSPRGVKQDFVNFDWDGVRLTISVHAGVEGKSSDPLRMMLNFTVADINATYERLLVSGVRFTRPPSPEPFGLVATFNDPDGNTLQLMQFA
ncbi:hypothetical protein AYO38_10210 [bacterium SCGC AG-212-C10]|nr:hypothetical protein AYO38_10210 [bacterium SCGC AG-212-C10]